MVIIRAFHGASTTLKRGSAYRAGVAQLVEQRTCNAKVGSSILLAGTTIPDSTGLDDPKSSYPVHGSQLLGSSFVLRVPVLFTDTRLNGDNRWSVLRGLLFDSGVGFMIDSYFPNGIAPYLIGGLLIGSGVALLFVTTGRQGGASTFLSAVWSWVLKSPFFQQAKLLDSRRWRGVYALGMLLGGLLYALMGLPMMPTHLPAWKFVLGGLLIGFGARLGGGCTSGHGICGMASASGSSILMVCTFLGTAMATALLMSALGI